MICRAQVDHDAVQFDEQRWLELEYVGVQPDVDDEGNDAPLELRNCACGSTLCRPAKMSAVPLLQVIPVEPEWSPYQVGAAS